MKIAIPLFNERVAPDFSTAPELLVVVSQRGKVSCRWRMQVSQLSSSEKVRKMAALGIDRLICGGIDESSRAWLQRRGIEVIPDAAGQAEEVLSELGEGFSAS